MSSSDSRESQSSPATSESQETKQIRNVQKPSIKTATSLLFSAFKKSKQNKNALMQSSASSQDIMNIDESSSSSFSPSVLAVAEDSASSITTTTISLATMTEKPSTNTTFSDVVSLNEENSSKSIYVEEENLAHSKTEIKSKKEPKAKVNKSKRPSKLIESRQFSSISSYESCQQTPSYSIEQQNELSFVSSDDAFYSAVKKVDSNNNLLETTIQSEENLRKSSTSTIRSICKLTDEKLNAKPVVLIEKLSDAEYKSALEREGKLLMFFKIDTI